jgi:hypothetical protein
VNGLNIHERALDHLNRECGRAGKWHYVKPLGSERIREKVHDRIQTDRMPKRLEMADSAFRLSRQSDRN